MNRTIATTSFFSINCKIFCHVPQKSLEMKNTNFKHKNTHYIKVQVHTFISIVSNRTNFTQFHLSHRSQPFFNWITCINGMVYLHLRRDFVHFDTQDINRCICVYVCLCSISSRRVHAYILFWRHIYKTLNGSGERLNAMCASFIRLFFPCFVQFFHCPCFWYWFRFVETICYNLNLYLL